MSGDPAGALRALAAPAGGPAPGAARALRRRLAALLARCGALQAVRGEVTCGGPVPWARAVLRGPDAGRVARVLADAAAGRDSVEVARAPGGAWAVTVRICPAVAGANGADP